MEFGLAHEGGRCYDLVGRVNMDLLQKFIKDNGMSPTSIVSITYRQTNLQRAKDDYLFILINFHLQRTLKQQRKDLQVARTP